MRERPIRHAQDIRRPDVMRIWVSPKRMAAAWRPTCTPCN